MDFEKATAFQNHSCLALCGSLSIMRLEHKYRRGFELLIELFGSEMSDSTVARLNKIHDRTEAIWHRYVAMIPNQTVRYVLFAEAPPWSASGQPQYILDPESRPRTLMRALCCAFFGGPVYKDAGVPRTLEMLAELGFLVIDTLPFAMDYGDKRSRRAYGQLVADSCSTYLEDKLAAPELNWSDEVRLAFGFKLNALSVINSLGGEIALKGDVRPLSEEMIAVTGAGYPDGRRLGEIYGLSVKGAA